MIIQTKPIFPHKVLYQCGSSEHLPQHWSRRCILCDQKEKEALHWLHENFGQRFQPGITLVNKQGKGIEPRWGESDFEDQQYSETNKYGQTLYIRFKTVSFRDKEDAALFKVFFG